MADYPINKGIGHSVEFKGLKAQYLFIFAGGLLAVFFPRGASGRPGTGDRNKKARSFGNDRACAYCAERDAVTSDNPA